jgi:hypothetical protein
MRLLWLVPLALCLLAAVGRAGADEPADAGALLDKTLQAAGGEATLAKYPAFTLKAKGKVHEDGEDVPYTCEWSSQGLDRSRAVYEYDIGGVKSKQIQVVQGDQGWTKSDDDATEEMDKDMLEDAKEELYFNWVASLVPLKNKAYHLTVLGEVKVEGRPAVVLKVSHKDRTDIKLFFDKENWLLVKTEAKVKDREKDNKEVLEETLLSDYKRIDGVQQAMKVVTRRDGQPYLELEVTEIKLFEKLDDRVFAKP